MTKLAEKWRKTAIDYESGRKDSTKGELLNNLYAHADELEARKAEIVAVLTQEAEIEAGHDNVAYAEVLMRAAKIVEELL